MNLSEFWKNNKKKIKWLLFLLGIYFLFFDKSCSCYKVGLRFKDGSKYMFTKPNIRALYRGFEFLYGNIIEKPKAENHEKTLLTTAKEELDKVELALLKNQLKKKKKLRPVFTAEISPKNVLTKGQGDKDAKRVRKRLARIKKERMKEKKPIAVAEQTKKEEKKASKGTEEKKKEEKEDTLLAQVVEEETRKSQESETKKEKTDETNESKEKEIIKTYKTLAFHSYDRRRLASGKCFEELPCFNGPGKDYNLLKVPGKDLFYFLSNRVEAKIKPTGNRFGYFSLFAMDAKPTSNQYEPEFLNVRKIQLKGVRSSILGFTLFVHKGKIHLIFSNGHKLLEATSTDGTTFSTPKQLSLPTNYILRDPSISKDGKLLVFAEENKSKWETWVSVVERNSPTHDFIRYRQVEDSLQSTGSGVFPALYERGNRKFIFYRVFEKMYSVEILKEDFTPPVELTGTLPEKYMTFIHLENKQVFIGSMHTKTNSYDLARFKLSAKPVTVTRKIKSSL
ncbi:MAG: hypothetical protein D6767_07715 [Candidatus Hydrogenedentota bacterium]|nr:MAG: hypothetical protein D6767_07715 [Candidatus Hydrogenedentota bacterium]